MKKLMNTEVKEKWITALTSGEFKQGQNVLQRADGSYCCLGVLCEVYRRETNEGEWSSCVTTVERQGFTEEEPIYKEQINILTFNGEKEREPEVVTHWAGFDKWVGAVLAEMNDTGSSFAEIAEYIKESL